MIIPKFLWGRPKMNDGLVSGIFVLDAGLGWGVDLWSLVQPAVASFTRVCSYDRVGMVLVDTPHPDHLLRWLVEFPPAGPDEHPEMTESRAEFTQIIQGTSVPPPGPGQVDLAACIFR